MRKLVKFCSLLLIILCMPALLYSLLVIVGGVIPVNRDTENNGSIKIYVVRNGSHTDIVVPIKTEVINWENIILPQHFSSNIHDAKFYSFGWGDRQFFRATPYWEDLKFKTSFNALFVNTPSAIHVRKLREINSEKIITLNIDKTQYRKLSEYFLKHLEFTRAKTLDPLDFRYSDNDVFYNSRSSFHAFRTCNSWVNNALKYSGLRACLWTPFTWPIFWQYS